MNKIDYDLLDKYKILLASDEVGRGCLAGDLIICSIKLKQENISFLNKLKDTIKDSKKLSSKKRQLIIESLKINLDQIELNKLIEMDEFSFVVINKNPEYIDNNNILKSTMDSFYESWNICKEKNLFWIIDGNKIPNEVKNDKMVKSIVKGDNHSLLIGLASIIAKEYRDNQMLLLDSKYPNYEFKNHKGYGTKNHYEAIKKNGIIENIHRKSFLKKILS
jgi:ribonuclease HII